MAKSFESRIQNLVYNVDVGMGLGLIKLGLYTLSVLILLVIYTATQFTSFGDAEAMEYAQLGRNFSERGKWVTQVVRPSTIRFLIEHKKTTERRKDGQKIERDGDPRFDEHPDIIHPPLWRRGTSHLHPQTRSDRRHDRRCACRFS